MAAKLFVLSFLCIVLGSSAFSLNKETVRSHADNFLRQVVRDNTPRLDYGPSVVAEILKIIATIPPSFRLFEDSGDLNLTEISLGLLNSTLIKGQARLREFTIDTIPDTEIPVCSIIMNGIIQPLTADVQVKNPTIVVHGLYKTDAVLLNLLPVHGEGTFRVGLNLEAGVQASVKLLGSPLTLTSFDYQFGDLENLDLKIDGLLGGGDLNDVVIDIVREYVPIIEKQIHSLIQEAAKELFLSLDLTLNDLLGLLNPTTLPPTTTAAPEQRKLIN